jgi:hypothetical protein
MVCGVRNIGKHTFRNAMKDYLRSGQLDPPPDMTRRGYVPGHPTRGPASGKCKQQATQAPCPSEPLCIAPDAFCISPRHEVPRANAAVRLVYQKTVRAHRLVSIMFEYRWFSEQPREGERNESGIGNMDRIGGPHEFRQLETARPANHPERQDRVVHPTNRRLRDHRHLDGLADVGL